MLIDTMEPFINIQQHLNNKEQVIDLLQLAINQNDKDLSKCFLIAQKYYNVPEKIIIDILEKVEVDVLDSQLVYKINQKFLEDSYYINIGKRFALFILNNNVPRKRGEILFEKLISQFCYDYENSSFFYNTFIEYENKLLNQVNDKDKKIIESQITKIYQRAIKLSIKGVETIYENYSNFEKDQKELEKITQIFNNNQIKREQMKQLEQQFTEVTTNNQEEEILIFFSNLQELHKQQKIDIAKIVNFYEIYFFQTEQQISQSVENSYIQFLKQSTNPHVLYQQLLKLIRKNKQPISYIILYLRCLEQINKDDDEFEEAFDHIKFYVQENDLFTLDLNRIYHYSRQYITLIENLPQSQEKLRNLFEELKKYPNLTKKQQAQLYYELGRIESFLFDHKLNARAAFEKCVNYECNSAQYWRDYFYCQLSIQNGLVAQRDRLRGILKRAVEACKEERVQVVDEWLNFELVFGTVDEIDKAEERLQKALQQEEQLQSDEDEEEDDYENLEQQNQNHEKTTKIFVDNPKTIFVKNIPKTFVEQDLINLVQQFDVQECRIVKDRNGQSKGFAYIDFQDEEQAQQAAQQLQNKVIKGEKLYAAVSKPPKLYQDDKLTLYIGNLPYSITKEKLLQKAGEGVKDIRILLDETGKPKGYAYIEYIDQKHKDQGLEILNQEPFIDGRRYYAKISDSLEKIKQQQQNYSLVVKNLPFKLKEEEILKLFDGLTVTDINMPRHENGKPKGFAFVEFENNKDFQSALNFDKIEFKGRRLEIIKSNRQLTHKNNNVEIEQDNNNNNKPKSNADFKNLFKK